VQVIRKLVERLKLTRGDEARKTVDKLAQAGWRSRDILVVYLGARLVMPFVAGAGALFVLTTMGDNLSTMSTVSAAGAGVLIGAYAPVLLLRNAVARRYQKIRRQLPDALDLLVICAEAGLSLDAALTRVSREMGPSSPELSDEVGLTAIELGFLPNRRQALLNLIRRADLPPIRAVVNTLMQTERYGTPLANSLRVLATEFRDERMLRAEEKAAKLPAKMTVPMILFILPALFVVLAGPAAIQVFHTFR
jgi:tight adherence protein C